MQRIYLIYLHSFTIRRLTLHVVHLIGLSHVHLAAASKIKYLVEIVGTLILVYAVCSAATVDTKGFTPSGRARSRRVPLSLVCVDTDCAHG